MKANDDIAERVHERTIDFEHSFGNQDFFEEGVIRSLEVMFELCASYLGEECASRGFDTMVSCAFQRNNSDLGWREILDEDYCGIYSETQIGNLLHDLTAYADFGIVLATARDDDQRYQFLANQIQQAERLLALLPSQVWGLDDEHLVAVLRKSLARWKVDNGEPVTALELAVLSGRAPQTIKNKLAGNPAEINGSQMRIEAEEAAAWLSAQSDFNDSIWRKQCDAVSIVEADEGLGEVVFVPVAKDGSMFHAGLIKDGKYLIDAEGAEREFDDFDEALSALQKMPFPQWRRPTPEGRWTRVRCVEWRRVTRDELMPSA
ncbi:hypothetical protein [Aliiroseovarius sediminis]|uniref:hypothetical protein n=1 Tax=Aliiroseovarius sediminis TaxID=2925839 RepID=UPI001F58CF5A|nr:hypothetical protein [Aliiroseovarius sediminis]MCI2395076.1 hypothetical protein [Aliiroseovarius sediminis]